MSRISSTPGQAQAASDAAAVEQLAQAEQEKVGDEQGKVSTKEGKGGKPVDKKTAEQKKLAAALKPELDELLAMKEMKGDFLSALVASSEKQLDALPKGASRELVAELQRLSALLPAEPPSEIPEAFQLDLEGLSLPQLFKAPREVSGLLTATQALDGTKNQAWVRNTPRLELVKAYAKLIHASYDKLEQQQQTSTQVSQTLQTALREKLEKAAPEIAKIYKGYLDKSFLQTKTVGTAKLSDAGVSEEIEIPSPDMVQLEKVFKEVGPLLRQTWGKAGVDLQAVQARNALNSAITGINAEDGEAATATAETETGETAVGTGGGAEGTDNQQASGQAGSGGSGHVSDFVFPANSGMGERGLPGDIESLIIVVMMQATKVESDILGDQLKEMNKMTLKKKSLREMKTKMKQESLRLDAAMQEEFNRMKGSGQIHSSIKFEDYKAWRQCQWGDIGTNADGDLTFPPPQLEDPIPQLPDWMIYGNEVAAAEETTDATNNATQGYGLPAKLSGILKQLWEAMPEPRPATFDEYLTSLGMWPVERVPEDILENLKIANKAIENYRVEHAQTESVAPLTLAEFAQPNGATYKLMKEYMYLQVLAQAGMKADVTNEINQKLADVKTKLDSALAKSIPAPPLDATIRAAYDAAVAAATGEVTAAVKELSDIFNAWSSPTGGPGAAAVEAGATNYMQGNDALYADYEDIFQNGDNWVNTPDDNHDGKSWPTNFKLDENGLQGKGGFEEWDDNDSSGIFFCNLGKPSELKGLIDMVGAFGGTIGGSQNDMKDAITGMNSALGGLASGLALTGPVVGDSKVDEDGNPIIPASTLDEWSDYTEGLSDELEDVQDGGEGGAYSRWVENQDYDGQQAEQEAEEAQAAADAAAAQAALNQQEAAGKPRSADGTIMENEGNLAQFDAFVQEIDDQLVSLSELSEVEMIRMQALVDRRGKFIEALSNLIAKEGKLKESINSNLK